MRIVRNQVSLSLSPSEVRERIARHLLLTERPGFERSLSDHRLPGRGGQGELGQGCPQVWTEGSSPSRNSHSRDPRAAGKKARQGGCRPPRWTRATRPPPTRPRGPIATPHLPPALH